MAKRQSDLVVEVPVGPAVKMVVMVSPHGDQKECPEQVIEYLQSFGWKPLDDVLETVPSGERIAES